MARKRESKFHRIIQITSVSYAKLFGCEASNFTIRPGPDWDLNPSNLLREKPHIPIYLCIREGKSVNIDVSVWKIVVIVNIYIIDLSY